METQKQRPSILKGEQRFKLDERTKKAFGDFVEKSKQHKFNPDKHNQTIICGPEEFTETEKNEKAKE